MNFTLPNYLTTEIKPVYSFVLPEQHICIGSALQREDSLTGWGMEEAATRDRLHFKTPDTGSGGFPEVALIAL